MDYKTYIKHYERELNNNKGVIEQEYRKIAITARENPTVPFTDDPLYAEITQHCDELTKQKNLLTQTLHKAQRLKEQIEDRIHSIRRREKEKLDLEAELQQLFETSGSQIFDIYMKAPQQYIHYNSNLPRLDELFRERYKMENTITDPADESPPLIKRIVQQTKNQLLKGKLRKMDRKIAELFKNLSAEIAEEWLSRPGDDKKLAGILSPILDQHEKIAEIKKIILRHRKDIQGIQVKQKEFSENQNPENHVKHLQLRISETEEELRTELTKSGEILVLNLKDSPPETLTDSFTALENIFTENKRREELIHKLHAARQIEILKAEQGRIYQKKEKIRQKLSDLENQLQELSDSVNTMDSEITSHEKIRGNENDLQRSVRYEPPGQ